MAQHSLEGWIPIGLIARDNDYFVDWCYVGRQRFIEPFFEDSIAVALRNPFSQAFRRETPIESMVDYASKRPGIAPTVFIFHASRCGSTLLAQMLTALPHYIVASEPPMLDALLRLHHSRPNVSVETCVNWIRAWVSAMAQPTNGETHFAIKFDAWSIVEFDLVRRAYPDTPCIYLYRDPFEIGASQMAMRGAYMVPGMLPPALFSFDANESATWRAEEYVARVLGQMLDAGCAACANGQMKPVNYRALPDIVWTSLLPTLRITDDPVSIQRLQQAAQQDAKNPQQPFVRDSNRKPREVSDLLRDQITLRAMPAYRALENCRKLQ